MSAQPPAGDDPIRELLAGALALPVVLVAHELGLFRLLDDTPLDTDELADRLDVPSRSAELMVVICTAAGLVEPEGGAHRLTERGRAGFGDTSPTAYGAYLDLLRAASAMTSLDAVGAALRTGRPQAHRAGTGATAPKARRDLLARAMHDRGRLTAARWPGLVDLAGARRLLDVGGGTGVHAHAALRRWPQLRAVVLDLPPICALAEVAAADVGLADRLDVVPGDYDDPTTPLPAADVHLWSEVLHNRDPDQCRALLRRSHDELAPGGQVLVLEMVLDDDDGGPLAVAAASVNMLLWTRGGRQHRRGDLLGWLAAAGFEDLRHQPVAGYFELLSGRRPDR